jgi:hypothetical protein
MECNISPLGKGEVVSSILTGSTRTPDCCAFGRPVNNAQTSGRFFRSGLNPGAPSPD